MFDHFVWSVIVCPVAVAVAVRLLADRLRPDTAVPLLVVATAAAAGAALLNLVTFAVKALAELPAVAARFGLSADHVRADTSSAPWVSWVSVTLLATVLARMARVAWTHRRDTRFARRYTDLPVDADGVVVLDDPRAEAFAVPGRPGRIVVTTAMRAALDDAQHAALLAHERAHLAGRHHRLVRTARFAAAAHPAFHGLTRHIGFLVERAADERAAEQVGDRRAVAGAIGVAALVSAPGGRATGLRITPAGPGLRGAGVVPRRVASLLAPPGAGRLPLVGVPLAVALFSLGWTGECVWDLGELLAAAR